MALADNELIVTNGAMEALNLCLQAVTRPGDVVVVESPTFYGALQALERLHLRAVEVAACWFMPSFQNPLGALMPVARRQPLVELLAQHGVLHCSSFFRRPPLHPPPAAERRTSGRCAV